MKTQRIAAIVGLFALVIGIGGCDALDRFLPPEPVSEREEITNDILDQFNDWLENVLDD